MLSVAQQDLHLLRRVPLGLVDDLRWEDNASVRRSRSEQQGAPGSSAHLDGVLHAGAFVQAALADGVGADADVLLDLVGVGELRRAPVQLLRNQSQAGV